MSDDELLEYVDYDREEKNEGQGESENSVKDVVLEKLCDYMRKELLNLSINEMNLLIKHGYKL